MAIFRSEPWRAWWPRLVFLASAATLAAGMAQIVPLPLMHPLRDYRFFDLEVYRAATRVVAAGGSLYTAHLRHGLGFTYPPFAVLAMMPLRWMSVLHDQAAVTLGNIAMVAVAAHAAVRLRSSGPRAGAAGGRPGWIAAAMGLWAEPVLSTVGYGQINLLITTLVLVDLAYGRDTRLGGVGIGLAAALKLTPLIFIPYLAFTTRGRMAGLALATFALSIVAAFAALPRDAARYWGGTVFDVSRVTGRHHLSGASPMNQSLRGALLRLFPNVPHITIVWLPACLLVAGLGLLLAALSARRGNELTGFLLTAITGLLVSPISWTHHWAIVVPAGLAMVTSVQLPDSRRLLSLVAVELVVVSPAIWLVVELNPVGRPLGPLAELCANAYVIAGLAVLGAVGSTELRRAVGHRRARTRGRVRQQPLRVIPEAVIPEAVSGP